MGLGFAPDPAVAEEQVVDGARPSVLGGERRLESILDAEQHLVRVRVRVKG